MHRFIHRSGTAWPAVGASLALALLGATTTLAAPPPPARLDDAIRAAELIFEGTVQAVEFRNARAPKGRPAVPHTFVTWQIHQVFKGRTSGSEITARFLGGMPNPDELVVLGHGPRPDVGDRDVVFLRRNGKSICPLVGCDDGRLRLVGGSVFSESGEAFSLRPDGTIRLGETSDDPGFARWTAVGIERVRGGSTASADSAPGTTPSEPSPAPPAMSAAALRAVLEARVTALYTPAELLRLRPVESLDPERPFRFRAPRPVTPSVESPDDASERPVEGNPDSAEIAAYLAAGQNPVLPR